MPHIPEKQQIRKTKVRDPFMVIENRKNVPKMVKTIWVNVIQNSHMK